jgi:immunoglobulin heavy chain
MFHVLGEAEAQPWIECIGRIHPEDNKTIYTQNFSGSLTLTVDMSSSTDFMELSRLRAEDSAAYYCAR